jgi:WD40 repeat protein
LAIRHVAFSPDGKWLVGAGGRLGKNGPPWGGEGLIKVWNTTSWKLHGAWADGFTNPVDQLFFVSEEIVGTASDKLIRESRGSPYDGVVLRYWEIKEKKELPKVHLQEPLRAFGIGLFAKDKLVAYTPGDAKKTGVFSLPNMERICTLSEHSKGSWLLRFSSDGKRILSLAREKPFVRLHDSLTGKRLAEHNLESVTPDATRVHSVHARFSNNDKLIAVVQNGNVYVLASDLNSLLFQIDTPVFETRTEFAPNSDLIAITKAESVDIYSVSTKKLIKKIGGNPEGVNACGFSPDGIWIAIGGGGHPQGTSISPGKVRVFEVKTGKLVAELD